MYQTCTDLNNLIQNRLTVLNQYGHKYARCNLQELEKTLGGKIILPSWAIQCPEADRINDEIDHLTDIYIRRYKCEPLPLGLNYAQMFTDLVLKNPMVYK